MPSPFLPLLDGNLDPKLLPALGRIGPILVPASSTTQLTQSRIILFDSAALDTVNEVVRQLDGGALQAVVPLSLAQELIGTVPANRLLLLLDAANVSAVSEKVRNGVSGVLLRTSTVDVEFVTSVRRFFPPESTTYVQVTDNAVPSVNTIRDLGRASASLVVPTSQLTSYATSTEHVNVADAFVASLVSDRADGLFPTIVTSYFHGGKCLGLVYSSRESIAESIFTGKGVYQSRKHGLWRKGETSGATQEVVAIRSDCDSDSLEFQVIQSGSGFCHLGTPTCFGNFSGLAALESVLLSRLQSAPEGSYTLRLFKDEALLRSKIMEEADELCRAKTKEEIAFEAADLMYFMLTKCVSEGVNFTDIEASLDQKARKITRRAGNAKPQWSSAPKPDSETQTTSASEGTQKQQEPSAVKDDKIQMRKSDLGTVTQAERASLLRRPVLKSDEMIAKVRPIVDQVRKGGDSALKELTAKFDKAQLESPILRPPFAPEAMALPEEVRDAIDKAYANIRAFHLAQLDKEPLVVETMPGVVCTRFAKPINRVGLYVPGGTAVLPSTALMLGIPAQVAGCKEIVLAVPPRPDGSVVPEVLYAAHLVGATAVLKAGGGQAIAAMAYGTESVPKVDKIFGPGNQWVTAAKMLVQNDTDALVSIDMPAGPSEVLVISDQSGNPSFVAADLLSQAEHGVDSQVVLVAVNIAEEKMAEIEREIEAQTNALPRVDIIRQSIAKSLIVRASSVEQALEFSNEYAPEHLILHLENAQDAVKLVENAGSVFVGPYSPESCGDYASGTNHTLPTNGYARQFSGVNTQSFQKHITSQEVTQEGLDKLGPIVITIAEREGLEAHANAVRVRLNRRKGA
ncbi:trifunctional histidinol dehydrogenase [Tulasnella sp. 418]|nr:trifunctional histidinol dehydrogenase [Tulasnella sp. 418]